MGRVLKIGAVVMGVLLVVMTSTMPTGHADDQIEIMVVLIDGYEHDRLYWIDPDNPGMNPLTPEAGKIGVWGRSSDGTWLYYIAGNREDYGADNWKGTLYRVRVGDAPEAIMEMENVYRVLRPPDLTWLVYGQIQEAADGQYVYNLIWRDLATQEQHVLASIHSLQEVVHGYYIRLSADRQWIFFDLFYENNDNPLGRHQFYRVGLDGTGLEDITQYAGDNGVARYLEGEDIYLASFNNILYWQKSAGQYRRVIHHAQTVSRPDVVGWFAAERILVIQMPDVLAGYRPDAYAPVWQLNNVQLARDYPEAHWIIYQQWDDFTLWRMRPDGTDLIALVTQRAWANWQLTPDRQWLMYQVSDYEIRRVSIDGTQDELVFLGAEYSNYLGQSRDEQWFIVAVGNSDGRSIYRVSQDRTLIEQLTPELQNLEFRGWLITQKRLSPTE